MSIASHIPLYDSVPLVDFDALEPQFVHRPASATLRAWDKLEEVERRLDTFDWAAMVIRQPNRCTQLINDLALAYLLGFEATLQVLRNQWQPAPDFGSWLKSLAAYDIRCKGVRTLRNLEAHIRAGALTTSDAHGAYSRFYGPSYSGHAVGWRLPEISLADLNALDRPGRKLTEAELPLWNSTVNAEFATDTMRHALLSLISIVEAAR